MVWKPIESTSTAPKSMDDKPLLQEVKGVHKINHSPSLIPIMESYL